MTCAPTEVAQADGQAVPLEWAVATLPRPL